MARGSIIPALGPDALRQVREQLAHEATHKAILEHSAGVTKPRKYRNTPTVYKSSQGFERRYDSKKEAAFAFGLDHTEGWWIPQVPFPLPGGVTYRADFMHVGADGKPRFYDVKGRDTQASINKRKQVFALYGITVELA